MKTRKNALSLAIGTTALVGALAATPIIAADSNPFAFNDLGNGYMVADADTGKAKKDGSCGESKCGDKKAEKAKKDGSSGESKCGDKKAEKAKKDGSCGESKCGDKKSEKAM